MLTEKSRDADLMCKMVGFAAQRLIESDVGFQALYTGGRAGMIGIDCAATRFAVDDSITFTSCA
jgi:hypothetical protein